jgi:uncharacterized protein YndB with AHSA1/START domain
MSDTASATHELTFTCILDAPRDLVFRCMIEPEHLSHFWGPVGTSAPVDKITIDPQPGGVFEVTMVNDSDGAEYPMRGVYTEVDEPEKLVWVERDSEMTTTSLFIDLGDGRTEVRIHQTNVHDGMTTAEAQAGFKSSLDRFAAYLTTL